MHAQRANTDKALFDLDVMQNRMLQADRELRDQQSANASKAVENTTRQAELRRADQEVARVRQAILHSSKLKDAQQKRLNVIDQDRAELHRDHETLKTQVARALQAVRFSARVRSR